MSCALNTSIASRQVSSDHDRRPATEHRRVAWVLLGRRASTAATYPLRVVITAAMLIGAALIVATGLIHLHLWTAGYRDIPTIGPLFLIQAIVAVLLAAVLAGTRTIATAIAGAVFLGATAAGLFVSATVGLFGLHDGLDAPLAGVSLIVEGSGAAVLIVACLALAWSTRPNCTIGHSGSRDTPSAQPPGHSAPPTGGTHDDPGPRRLPADTNGASR
jgi:hypothetical protein